MIWTDKENMIRVASTMANHKGKSCANCHWGDANLKEENITGWTVCGHHTELFKVTSLCTYWTDTNDPRLKSYFKNRKKELLDCMKNKIE